MNASHLMSIISDLTFDNPAYEMTFSIVTTP